MPLAAARYATDFPEPTRGRMRATGTGVQQFVLRATSAAGSDTQVIRVTVDCEPASDLSVGCACFTGPGAGPAVLALLLLLQRIARLPVAKSEGLPRRGEVSAGGRARFSPPLSSCRIDSWSRAAHSAWCRRRAVLKAVRLAGRAAQGFEPSQGRGPHTLEAPAVRSRLGRYRS